jgi:hypothetical protein
VNVTNSLASREPAFTDVVPLQKGINLQTGELELHANSPFWAAGKVDGNANVLASRGRVNCTKACEATGNVRITFASAHPGGANCAVLADHCPELSGRREELFIRCTERTVHLHGVRMIV